MVSNLLCLVCLITVSGVPFALSQFTATTLPPTIANLPGVDSAASAASTASNLACETSPTHLLCNTSVALGHKIIQNLPAISTLRPCSVFLASPHCCAQFCSSGGIGSQGGTCDVTTGACFCKPGGGVPKVCQEIINTPDNVTPGMSANDLALLQICATTCQQSPYGCTKPAGVTDGIVGTVCFCYC